MKNYNSAPTMAELLVKHERSHQTGPMGEILSFSIPPELGVYNGTAPVKIDGGKPVSVLRVESPKVKVSDAQFFRQNGSPTTYDHDPNLPTFKGLEDPTYTVIGDEIFFGGVRVYRNPATGNIVDWDSGLWRADDIGKLDAERPPDIVTGRYTKGLRPHAIDGVLRGLFVRPADAQFPRGKERYLRLSSDESEGKQKISPDRLAMAPVVEGFIAHEAGEWGGMFPIKEKLAGMHLGRYALDGVNRKYTSGLAAWQEETFRGRFQRLRVVAQKITICRQCFPEVDAEGRLIVPPNPEVDDVFYLTGVDLESGLGYGGVSDSRQGMDKIADADDLAEMLELAA